MENKEEWQEITFKFRVKGLKLPQSDEAIGCQMRVRNVPDSPREVMGAEGPSKRKALAEGNNPRASPRGTPEITFEEEETVEEYDAALEDEELEGLIIEVTNLPTADQGAGAAADAGAEDARVRAQGAIPKMPTPGAEQATASIPGAAGAQTQEKPKTSVLDRLGPPTNAAGNTGTTGSKVLRLMRRAMATENLGTHRAQLAIEGVPPNETSSPKKEEQEEEEKEEKKEASIKDWKEEPFSHGTKDRVQRCLASHCMHRLHKSQIRGHCLRYHLPDYFCKEEENQGVYKVTEKVELRREAICKIGSFLGATNNQELLVAAKILIRQSMPNATITAGDVAEINLFLKETGGTPIPLQVKILDAGLNGLLCWQVAVVLLNALPREQRRELMPVLINLGEEKRLKKHRK